MRGSICLSVSPSVGRLVGPLQLLIFGGFGVLWSTAWLLFIISLKLENYRKTVKMIFTCWKKSVFFSMSLRLCALFLWRARSEWLFGCFFGWMVFPRFQGSFRFTAPAQIFARIQSLRLKKIYICCLILRLFLIIVRAKKRKKKNKKKVRKKNSQD